jgi:hypothetical protein
MNSVSGAYEIVMEEYRSFIKTLIVKKFAELPLTMP